MISRDTRELDLQAGMEVMLAIGTHATLVGGDEEEAGYSLVIGRYIEDDGGLAIGGVSAMATGGEDLSHLMGQLECVEYHRKRTDPLHP